MTVEVDASLATDNFSAELFHLLWGQDRLGVPTAVDYAYEHIWKLIIVGTFAEGQRLTDAALADELRLSRTPVRHALDRLVQDGLIHADPRRGYWVRVFAAQDVHEIYDLRGSLEVLALRLAAPHLDTADLAAQLDTLRMVRAQLDERPLALFLQADLKLHNLLIHASANGRLIRILAALRSQLSVFQVRDASYRPRIETALDDHERILHHLVTGEVEAAATALAAHIAHAKAGVLPTPKDTGSRSRSVPKMSSDNGNLPR